MTPIPDLLRSFLSCAPHWNASELALARETLTRLPPPMVLDLLRAHPALIMAMAGMAPDPWQTSLLRSKDSGTLLLCSRQAGKSTTTAALALRVGLLEPSALVLLLSPTQRQSGELFREKVLRLYNAIGRPIPTTQETQLSMTLANGSRIVSLPGDEKNVRGYSGVALLIVDEAARVEDPLYRSVRHMLAVSQGRMVALSTPFGKRGWFYKEWRSDNPWKRFRVPAEQCPRISKDFLDQEMKGPQFQFSGLEVISVKVHLLALSVIVLASFGAAIAQVLPVPPAEKLALAPKVIGSARSVKLSVNPFAHRFSRKSFASAVCTHVERPPSRVRE